MTKGKFKFSICLFFLFVTPAIIYGQNLTLNDAIQIALKNNEKIKQYQEKLYQKEYKDNEAFGNFLPNISVQGGYNHLNDAMKIDLDPIRQAIISLQANNQVELSNIYNILNTQTALTTAQKAYVYSQATEKYSSLLPAFEEVFKKQDYNTLNVTLVQPIFMGGKILAGKNYASAERKASEAELTKTKNEIIQETVNGYISVVLLDQVIKTRAEVLEGMRRHKADAEKLSAQGLIAPSNLLRAKVAVADAERNLFDDNNKKELAIISLRHTLGLEEDAPVNIEDSLFFTEIKDSVNSLLVEAYANQPIMELIAQKKEGASQKYVAERAEFLPQIAGFGKYEFLPKYLSSIEPKWVVGVQVSLKLFDGLKNWNRLQEAKHIEKEVEYLEDYTKKQINLWVNKSYRDMRNAEKRFQMLEASLDLGKENLRQNEIRFQTGLGTSLEVIDARLSLEKNQIERLTSLFEYYKAMTDVFVACGKTNEFLPIWNSNK
jgi:outer membrane protein TolC